MMDELPAGVERVYCSGCSASRLVQEGAEAPGWFTVYLYVPSLPNCWEFCGEACLRNWALNPRRMDGQRELVGRLRGLGKG